MAKAHLVLPDGTKASFEGTVEEVATLVAKCSTAADATSTRSGKTKSRAKGRGASKKTRRGPVPLIKELAKEGYFKSKRRLPDIQSKLEENGHIYAQTSLSPAVFSLTQQKILRRLKEKKVWVYVRGTADI